MTHAGPHPFAFRHAYSGLTRLVRRSVPCEDAAVNEVPTPRELRGAATVTQALAYGAGVAGVVAGALLYQAGQVGFAVVAWVLTFAAGAVLIIAAFLARGMAGLLTRLARMEQEIATLTAERHPGGGEPWRPDNRPL